MRLKEKWHLSLESFPLNSLSYHPERTDRAVAGILFSFLLLGFVKKNGGGQGKKQLQVTSTVQVCFYKHLALYTEKTQTEHYMDSIPNVFWY